MDPGRWHRSSRIVVSERIGLERSLRLSSEQRPSAAPVPAPVSVCSGQPESAPKTHSSCPTPSPAARPRAATPHVPNSARNISRPTANSSTDSVPRSPASSKHFPSSTFHPKAVSPGIHDGPSPSRSRRPRSPAAEPTRLYRISSSSNAPRPRRRRRAAPRIRRARRFRVVDRASAPHRRPIAVRTSPFASREPNFHPIDRPEPPLDPPESGPWIRVVGTGPGTGPGPVPGRWHRSRQVVGTGPGTGPGPGPWVRVVGTGPGRHVVTDKLLSY